METTEGYGLIGLHSLTSLLAHMTFSPTHDLAYGSLRSQVISPADQFRYTSSRLRRVGLPTS